MVLERHRKGPDWADTETDEACRRYECAMQRLTEVDRVDDMTARIASKSQVQELSQKLWLDKKKCLAKILREHVAGMLTRGAVFEATCVCAVRITWDCRSSCHGTAIAAAESSSW